MMCRLLSSLAIVWVFLFAAPVLLGAEEIMLDESIHQLVGEDYLYAIDFLFFTKLAEGQLGLTKTEQPNVYRAELLGRTLGVASWLSGDRTQTYTSLMELAPDGSLQSIEHLSTIRKRRWGKWHNSEKRQTFDYAQGKVFEQKIKDDTVHPAKEFSLPAGLRPVDMLTAFYNLRTGVYGPLVRGSKLLIPTFAKEKVSDIEVNVLTVEQQAKHNYFPSGGLLVEATVEPEIFETDSGRLYFWFDAAGTPSRGIVEDLIGLGDVRGYLEEGL